MDISKQRVSGNAAQTPEKRRLSGAGSPAAGTAAFQAWLEEEEEEWRIGQKLAATCPAEFICPISLDMMTEPVILAETGMTYERSAIRKWLFMGGDTCPLTGVRLSTTKVMAHKHLQRRIEKWVRARGMAPDTLDEESTADSLKAAVHSSFDEPELAPPSLSGQEDGVPMPGSPGASTTAPSTVGASTVGPSSIHKLQKPGKVRSEGSANRSGSCRLRARAAPAAGDANVKRGSILLRALSSSTLAKLTSANSQGGTPNLTPRSKCEPVFEVAVPEEAPEEPLLRAPPNSPAVLPRGQGMVSGQHSRTVSQEELPRAAPGSNISTTNPVYRDFESPLAGTPTGPVKGAAAAFSPRIHATCSAGCEYVELVEGPVVEELQAEKVSLPLEEGGVVLAGDFTEIAPVAAPETATARDGDSGCAAAEAACWGAKPRKGKAKKRRSMAEWVSVMEASPPEGQSPAGEHALEGAFTASFRTAAELHGKQEAEGSPVPTAPTGPGASGVAAQRISTEGTGAAKSGLLHSLSRSFSRRCGASWPGLDAQRETAAVRRRARSTSRKDTSKQSSYPPPRLSETGTAATSGAVVVRAPGGRPGWMAALLTSSVVPGLTALALPTFSCLGYRLFWSRCFGCMSAPDVLSLDIPEDAGLRMQSVLDTDEYFHSEDNEVVSVHTFARRIIADYMPPVTAGVPLTLQVPLTQRH